eukprot:CAMPEP_0194147172 /NCGR_PEP_ID=MMETSP0152-20130528/22564_1 /TAXON_ID=1049557 /ORGANISM="Thalassiothrix antarctica, Strain L6-D1" /LENGTH=233 /DNA_ID=CAMNT_0038847875 /DNA_START=28 /DNA_END=729 /DNA_ORIENTATION=+
MMRTFFLLSTLFLTFLLLAIVPNDCESFLIQPPHTSNNNPHRYIVQTQNKNYDVSLLMSTEEKENKEEEEEIVAKPDKFTFWQRIESIKSGVVGLFAGGIALTPASLIHDTLFGGNVVQNGFAQWEFDTDMGSLQGALFAIVYRYCIREGDDNKQLNDGIVGAFVVTRTLSKIVVPVYCTAAPLDCGDPLGYFDWDMLNQAAFNGLESQLLFGGAAMAMDSCFKKGWISKFPA